MENHYLVLRFIRKQLCLHKGNNVIGRQSVILLTSGNPSIAGFALLLIRCRRVEWGLDWVIIGAGSKHITCKLILHISTLQAGDTFCYIMPCLLGQRSLGSIAI